MMEMCTGYINKFDIGYQLWSAQQQDLSRGSTNKQVSIQCIICQALNRPDCISINLCMACNCKNKTAVNKFPNL